MALPEVYNYHIPEKMYGIYYYRSLLRVCVCVERGEVDFFFFEVDNF